jgi:hypothetical protein
MRTPPRSLLASIALALLAVQLAASVSWALLKSFEESRSMLILRNETPLEQRSRTYGPDYTMAIERIRQTIPLDGAYVLINGHPDEEEGGPLWVKFDLAPRRAVYLGKLSDLQDVDRLRRRMPRAARWVVIAHGSYEPPILIERYRFVQQIRERHGA